MNTVDPQGKPYITKETYNKGTGGGVGRRALQREEGREDSDWSGESILTLEIRTTLI